MATRLTKTQQRKKKQADMKALFNKTKNEQLRKGQKGMTLKQRQADDMTVSRKNLLKKSSKSDADYEKKLKSMIQLREKEGMMKNTLKTLRMTSRKTPSHLYSSRKKPNILK